MVNKITYQLRSSLEIHHEEAQFKKKRVIKKRLWIFLLFRINLWSKR